MMVLFSNRNSLDISAWISVPLPLTDVFDSFEWPFEPMFVSLWMIPLPFMNSYVDKMSYQR
jgi:hypothetical protein